METSPLESIGQAGAVEQLRQRGQRVTPARSAVLSVLATAAAHLDAREIVDQAARRAPGVHRATVYRALATLCDLGIVTHTHVAGAGAVYHLAAVVPDAPHAHLQCRVCGRLIDLPASALEPLSHELRDRLRFTLEPERATLLGVCEGCRTD